MPAKYCPDCGGATLRLIENAEPDCTGEYKEILSCDSCENIVYVFRDPAPVQVIAYEGMIDHDDEDRRAYQEERIAEVREFHHREGGGD